MPEWGKTRRRSSGILFMLSNAVFYPGSLTRSILCLGLLIGGIGAAYALEIHSERHCLFGCPSGSPPTNDLIIRDIYIISSNDTTKLADWVAYRVTGESVGRSQHRYWRRDPLLAADETLAPDDYSDAHRTLGTDRGHQVPLAAFSGTDDWSQTNYLSNITPQASGLNQGPWNQLEAAVRRLVTGGQHDSAYVMSGPLYRQPRPSLPRARLAHLVPSHYWKIIAVRAGDQVRAVGFLLSQSLSRSASFCEHTVPLETIEAASGLAFFHGLDAQPAITVTEPSAQILADLGCPTE